MPLPIIFTHRGDDAYLSYSLRQAKASNPESQVILIGTARNQNYATDGIDHVMLDPYMQSASGFAPLYKHIHIMPHEYNLFCFQRWFLLRDFMRQNNISRCCYLDSDVMLYADVNDPAYSQFMMEFVWTNFVSVEILEHFCAFLTAHFANQELFAQLVQETIRMQHVSNNLPLVSDMVLGLLFLRQFPHHPHTHGRYGDRMFDENINRPIWAESVDGKRKVYLIAGKLYTRDAATRAFVQLNSLHFQGLVMKDYMPFFFTPYLATEGSFSFDYGGKRWHPVLIEGGSPG